jgi:hypothetical protein
LKGRGFSNATKWHQKVTGLCSAEKGSDSDEEFERHTSGAEAHVAFIAFAARLKVVP